MTKRAFKRINTAISARFYCEKTDYIGTVKNISEKGMFINTENVCFPFNAEFEIILIVDDEVMTVPVEVRRFEKKDGSYNGIGVELTSPSDEYLKFVNGLRDDRDNG